MRKFSCASLWMMHDWSSNISSTQPPLCVKRYCSGYSISTKNAIQCSVLRIFTRRFTSLELNRGDYPASLLNAYPAVERLMLDHLTCTYYYIRRFECSSFFFDLGARSGWLAWNDIVGAFRSIHVRKPCMGKLPRKALTIFVVEQWPSV